MERNFECTHLIQALKALCCAKKKEKEKKSNTFSSVALDRTEKKENIKSEENEI